MKEVSLQQIFKQSEDELKERIRGQYLPRDYKTIQHSINEHITRLISGNNEFKESLNSSDAEVLNSILRMTLSYQKLTLTKGIDFAKLSTSYEFDIQDAKGNDLLENTFTLLPTVICAFINPWLAAAMGGATFIYKHAKLSSKPTVSKRKIDISKPISEDLILEISDAIEDICKEIDSLIIKIQRDRTDLRNKYLQGEKNKTLESQYPQILQGLQYLFMENIKTGGNIQSLQNMLFQLGVYGYKIVEYSDETQMYFKKQVKVGIESSEMYLPAIIRELEDSSQIVAVQGVLYVPNKK